MKDCSGSRNPSLFLHQALGSARLPLIDRLARTGGPLTQHFDVTLENIDLAPVLSRLLLLVRHLSGKIRLRRPPCKD